ncbi:unnamed protein product [Oncorhynchus mykiss]|uniref:WH1 domain-containing protein n=1 Tax=Oncorhynchus mykiss TaxID=8022 RepID=A0A060WB86_ONCMY|nr:unnamed protein product [Oncorhynchus mykiss]
MNSHSQQRRVGNIGSILLTPQENECLFNYLGRKCNTLCSAVVQVYGADRSSSWMKRCCGVACLIKDNPLRSYFIRVFDIKEGKTMFEQELYNNFSINSSRSYFISFAGDNCQVGLNFASEEEAKRFRAALNELLGRRQRKTGPALPMATVDIKNPEINNVRFHNSQQQLPQPHHINNMLHSSLSKKEKKVKCKRKKLTKADIGTPSNFQHIGHVGWDPNTGFDLNNLDPELKNLFDMCGISEAQLKDKETSKVIYDFIEKKGGVEAVKNELRRQVLRIPPTVNVMNFLVENALHGNEMAQARWGLIMCYFSRAVQVVWWLGPSSPTTTIARWPGCPATSTLSGPHLGPSPTTTIQAWCPRNPPSTPAPHQRGPTPATTTTSCTLACQHSTPGPTTTSPTSTTTLRLWSPSTTSSTTPTWTPAPSRSALLEQIRGGTQLKKVEAPVSKPPATTVGRDALLDQIRQGIQLKTVPDGPDSGSPTPAPSAGIVGALMEVMQKRSKAIHSSGWCPLSV